VRIGIAYDMKDDAPAAGSESDDASEEYDPPETIDALARTIEDLGHETVRLGGGRDFLRAVVDADVDLVFNIAEGRGVHRSREAQVPSVLEMLGIPYTGSDPLTLAVGLDKAVAKRIVASHGVSTPWSLLAHSLDEVLSAGPNAFTYPLVVKPTYEGSSKGVRADSKVGEWASLVHMVALITQEYRQPALVERFVPGREVTVGIVGHADPRVVGVMEVVPNTGLDDGFMYTLEVKRNYRAVVRYDCPPRMAPAVIEAIEREALAAFQALGCRDVARLDFRVTPASEPVFIEANPLPGMGSYSDLPIMAGLRGWSFSRLVEEILSSAIERTGAPRRARATAHTGR
jgi:D-alanine-D-alanine ligase